MKALATNVSLDRPHRFAEGDKVEHTDGGGACEIRERTLRVIQLDDETIAAYPTYSLWDPEMGEMFGDILDTKDLVLVSTTRLQSLRNSRA